MAQEYLNTRLTIAYDGTNYHGWQIQKNANSIQSILEDAIKVVLREEVKIIGSGRTDAGVHAKGQTANFKHSKPFDHYRFLGSINGLIPYDIRLTKVEKAPLDFHSQYNAISKTYHYNLHLDKVLDPFNQLYRYHVKEKIDLDLFMHAARLFEGTHDFTSFANESYSGCAAYDPIRTVKRLDVIPQEGGVRIEIEADGFLYKMVRNIVGTLLDIAKGRKALSDIPIIFEAKDRRRAGIAVPPHGLFLIHVAYLAESFRRNAVKSDEVRHAPF